MKMSRNKYELLEAKCQDLVDENLQLSREIMNKDLDISNWKEKYENVENILSEERKSFINERLEWKNFKDDLLLVVRAADDYKTDAMKTVEKYKVESANLCEQIGRLEAKIRTLTDVSCACRRVIPENQALLSEIKTNKIEKPTFDEEFKPFNSIDVSSSPIDDVRTRLPRDNNKENCGDYEFKSHHSNSLKRGNGVAFMTTKLPGSSTGTLGPDAEPLITFVKIAGGSKRNALLRWCQNRTRGYRYVDITNFSTSWSDGMALNALLHSFVPDLIPYDLLRPENSRENFDIAFKAAEAASIPTTLSIEEMVSNDRPSWEKVMNYVKDIYIKLENCDEN